MEVLGRIKVIGETESFGGNGFRKREFVITTDEQYPQHIAIEATQGKCDLLNSYKVGDSVKASINLRGREWVNPQGETKYFNSIQMWRIERASNQTQVPIQQSQPAQQFEPATNYREEEHDDLPFN